MAQEDRLSELVRELVIRSLQLQIDPDQLDMDEPLFGGDATVDSMGALEIVAAIEGRFGLQIPDEDLRVELFDSVGALTRYVAGRNPELDEIEPVG